MNTGYSVNHVHTLACIDGMDWPDCTKQQPLLKRLCGKVVIWRGGRSAAPCINDYSHTGPCVSVKQLEQTEATIPLHRWPNSLGEWIRQRHNLFLSETPDNSNHGECQCLDCFVDELAFCAMVTLAEAGQETCGHCGSERPDHAQGGLECQSAVAQLVDGLRESNGEAQYQLRQLQSERDELLHVRDDMARDKWRLGEQIGQLRTALREARSALADMVLDIDPRYRDLLANIDRLLA